MKHSRSAGQQFAIAWRVVPSRRSYPATQDGTPPYPVEYGGLSKFGAALQFSNALLRTRGFIAAVAGPGANLLLEHLDHPTFDLISHLRQPKNIDAWAYTRGTHALRQL